MDDKQFRELRTLILDQSIKIAELSLEVRKLKQAVETTEVVCLSPEEMGEATDIPDDMRKFFPD